MIKDAEIAMVHAATYALEYQDKKYNADVEEIIKEFLTQFRFEVKANVKVYSIAAISEIVKLRNSKENKGKSNKQLIQMFVKEMPEFSRRINEDSE
jgi:hypothetical protein